MTGERATKKQQLLLEYVAQFIVEHDYGPSYREIMTALGYKSVSTVAAHVEALIKKGFLERKDNSARSLSVVMSAEPSASQQKSDAKDDVLAILKRKAEELAAGDSDTKDADITAFERVLELLGYDEAARMLQTRESDAELPSAKT